MSDLLADFEERVTEIDKYFQLVGILNELPHSTRNSMNIAMMDIRVLKANCYLLLYNLIEGSVNEGLSAIFMAINTQSIAFNNLNDNYRVIYLSYQSELLKIVSKKTDIEIKKLFNKELAEILDRISFFSILDYYLPLSKSLEDKANKEEPEKLSDYKSYLKITLDTHNEISGNVTIETIEKISKKYAFNLPKAQDLTNYEDRVNFLKDTKEKLLDVKNTRNELAHGSKSFSEIGQVSLPNLINTKERIIQYLRILLRNIDSFIDEQGYLKKP